jgi:hypothetical protein
MYTTFQNIKTDTINFDSLIGKYICFLSTDHEDLTMTTGKFVTNCNCIYKVLRNTNSYMIVESTSNNGLVEQTKLKKDSFETYFFDKFYVICDEKPVWNSEVGTYTIKLPDYTFDPTTDISKSFTVEEINELLTKEFLGKTKTYGDVQNCIETLCNTIMKRHFDYVNIGRSYFEYTNFLHIGLNIKTGKKYLECFGEIEVKSYRNKINFIEFKPINWFNKYSGFENYNFTTLEDIIVKYLTDNKEYIDNLK